MSCKLYLVPEDVINTWRAEQRANTVDKPVHTLVNQMDSNLSNILQKDISEYDKEKLYSQEMSKYLSMRQRQQVPTRTNSINPQELMASIPKMYRNKAQGLLQYLQSDKDVEWDDQGHVYVDQKKIDKTHILDLIHDAMRLRKKAHRPHGWHELSSHLRKRNVPRELVGNPEWFDTKWVTPPTSPTESVESGTLTPGSTKGIKRSLFKQYKPAKKRVIGVNLPTPVSVLKPRKSKLAAKQRINKWVSVSSP